MDNSNIFFNSDYIVVEYIDLIKSPYFILLDLIRKNDRIREILKLELIDGLDDDGLYEWYINRKHKNFLIDLNRYPDKISNEELDKILDDQISLTPVFFKNAEFLTIRDMMIVMKEHKMVKDIIIYYPHSNTFAKEDLEYELGYDFTFMSNFDEILDLVGRNSTFFLSDIDLVYKMRDRDILQFSSITIPIEYRYNKIDMENFKIDFLELYRKTPFKYTYYRACSYEAEIYPEEEQISDNNDEYDDSEGFNMNGF